MLVRYGGKVQAQAVLSQSSFYSCNDPRLHFGLGSSNKADIEFSGQTACRRNHSQVAADQLTFKEGTVSDPQPGWTKT